MKGILAQKIGMTQVICPETGVVTGVTVCEVPKNSVLQVKTVERDGYSAAVIGAFERKKGKNVGKKFKFIREVGLDEGDELKKGDELALSDFAEIKKLKLTGYSKGRGFAGVIKRHKFSRGPETHGSKHHREPGSVGMCAKPARILKGKKMPGHMGNAKTTLSNVEVIDVDLENSLIVLKGAVPGAKKGFVFLREK
ncbi:MAG: 50S ribosomal protein L3 [Candidatus Peregrinibacteria bacterium]|nr:50S ribosomal protein L3 [Candidatus Peregrinibacteria bacterium]